MSKYNIEKVLEDYAHKGFDLKIDANITDRKESSVWMVHDENGIYALKIYNENRYYNSLEPKVLKKYSKNRNYGKFEKNLDLKVNPKHIRWEYEIVSSFSKDNALVPNVYAYTNNSILYEFIGDENGPAMMLKNLDSKDMNKDLLYSILSTIEIFLMNGIVHGDISGENILMKDRPYVIDFPQSLDTRVSDKAQAFLRKDVDSLIMLFSGSIDISESEIKDIYHRFYIDTY